MSLRRIADYTVIRELRRGGMGTVFEALSPMGVTVALKTVIWPELADARARWEAIERFQREARAARSLTHPNICRVLDCGADQDSLFIVMEFLDGENIRGLIEVTGPIKVDRAVQIILCVGEALAYAHEQGVIHRDIKPENIMVLRRGQVKLTDFGLASVVQATTLTEPGVMMGTLFYMSPEQVRGERVDARSDIFSLGATFYEMLTGARAFQAEGSAAVMHKILTADPPLVQTLPGHVSRALQKCLRKEPQERFQSVREVIASLSGVEPDSQRHPTAMLPRAVLRPVARSWRCLRRLPRALSRRPALAALAAAILAIGGVALLQLPTPPAVSPPKPRFPPDLRPLQRGLVATTLYSGTGRVGGIASASDGSLLVTVGSAEGVPPGVYQARTGDDCDRTDAYTVPGTPFVSPGGIARYRDGRVVVADKGCSTVWLIPFPNAPPEVLTREIPSPCDVAIAPPGFQGPNVKPGDVLVCADSSAGPARSGLYRVDPETHQVHRLAGPPELRGGLVHAEFAPDGRLYAVEDTDAREACTVVTVSPEGQVTTVSYKLSWGPSPHPGPIALDPRTGELYFAHHSTIYRLPAGGRNPEKYASGGGEITALEFSPDGSSLLVGDTEAGVIARIGPYPIEGRLLVSAWSETETASARQEFAYLMEGSSERVVPVVTPAPTGMSAGGRDLSPVASDQVVYFAEREGPEPWPESSQIWKSDLAGRNRVRLGSSLGSRGINCLPLWSPDGRRVAFLRCDPRPGEKPCAKGLDLWVMNADGTDPELFAYPARSERLGSRSFPDFSWWSKDGGFELRVNYGTGGPSANGSPDGKRTVGVRTKEGKRGGEPGVWRQLYIGDSRGRNEQVLVQWFVTDSDVARHLRLQGQDPNAREWPEWMDNVREWVGPIKPRWSPDGKHVAFLAAYPFLPGKSSHSFQVEVWIYELSTGILAKLTDNTDAENALSWRPDVSRADLVHRGR